MPRAAAMTSSIKVATAAFAQSASGEWLPNSVNWTSLPAVPCRIFPASERAVKATFGENLQIDAICWVVDNGSLSLPSESLTGGSGDQLPVQVTDTAGNTVQYMAVSARSLANMGKVLAVALRRYSHG